MKYALLQTVVIIAIILFWLLVMRIIAALLRVDPYHPVSRLLFTFTEKIVAPFRIGIFRRPARFDLAVIPVMLFLLLVIIYLGTYLWVYHT